MQQRVKAKLFKPNNLIKNEERRAGERKSGQSSNLRRPAEESNEEACEQVMKKS